MKKIRTACLQLILFSILLALLPAEPFRVLTMHQAELSADGSKTTVQAGINDGIQIILPDDRRFVQGIQIDLRIPKSIASVRDSTAYSFWTDCRQTNSEIDFTGTCRYLDTVPGKLSQTLLIPIDDTIPKKNDPYMTVIPGLMTDTADPMILRFQLVMKGVPSELYDAVIDVDIKAVLSNEGLFSLELNNMPEADGDSPVFVYIDGQLMESWDEAVLPTGLHHLSVISEDFRNEVRTFNIEQGKTTHISIDLEDVIPQLHLVSPENVLIYLDDELVESPQDVQLISVGKHSVKFVLADYELIKYFEAANGKIYTISLSVSLDLVEE